MSQFIYDALWTSFRVLVFIIVIFATALAILGLTLLVIWIVQSYGFYGAALVVLVSSLVAGFAHTLADRLRLF